MGHLKGCRSFLRAGTSTRAYSYSRKIFEVHFMYLICKLRSPNSTETGLKIFVCLPVDGFGDGNYKGHLPQPPEIFLIPCHHYAVECCGGLPRGLICYCVRACICLFVWAANPPWTTRLILSIRKTRQPQRSAIATMCNRPLPEPTRSLKRANVGFPRFLFDCFLWVVTNSIGK